MRRARTILLPMVVALALGAPAAVLQGAATTFTVTKTADTADGTCDADCSLREAITAANANAGTDTIAFAIPGPGPHTIQPTSALPTITDPVIIDGYTQAGASANTNGLGQGFSTVLKIELDGSSAGADVAGLRIAAGSSTVRGLVINRFDGNGIKLETNGDNEIEGNFVGTNVAGTLAAPNSKSGISIASSIDNMIGGLGLGVGNLISGNGRVGVLLATGADQNIVQGNLIGVRLTGASGLPNESHGIAVSGDDNLIGGEADGAGNTIGFNAIAGIRSGVSGTGNRFLGNSIHSNASLGIDLGGGPIAIDGVTANDAGDGDAGPNNLQNFPVLTSVVTGAGTGITIGGSLDSTANAVFRVEFFANTACDPSGNGEGETFLGVGTVTTDGSGNAAFVVGLTKTVLPGEFITATATDPDNNTSEFSACLTASAAPPVPGIGGPGLAVLAALLAAAFAWTAHRRARATATAR